MRHAAVECLLRFFFSLFLFVEIVGVDKITWKSQRMAKDPLPMACKNKLAACVNNELINNSDNRKDGLINRKVK